jgi:hypothetical protein
MSSRSSLVDKSVLQQQTEPDNEEKEDSKELLNPDHFYQDLQINLFKPDPLRMSRSSNNFGSSAFKCGMIGNSIEDELQPNSTAEFKLNLLQPVDIKADKVEYFHS